MSNPSITRRQALTTTLAAGLVVATQPVSAKTREPFELDELTISDLQDGMKPGRFTAASLVDAYLARIDTVDRKGPALRSVIELNPDAHEIAAALDQERKAKGPRGPLHGIPILIKDNIDTADKMHTTAGSLAMMNAKPSADAFLVKRLRDAGAVILGKTNLSEWANIRCSHSTSGWSARGGLTRNPYALDRNTSGSSSGTGAAVAANLCAAGVGTETDGSITSPSSTCGLVGLKPTVGLVSRTGIIPISHSQDTAGPMTRTVRDAAVLLSALAGVDPGDAATTSSSSPGSTDYTKSLDVNGLSGARLGVVRKLSGFHDGVDALFEENLTALKKAGAVLIDPIEMPSIGKVDEPELLVLLYELKADLAAYLKRLGASAPAKSLADVIDYNNQHADQELRLFGQDLFLKAQAKGDLSSKEYVEARAKCLQLAQKDGIDAALAQHKLDALIAPTGGPAWLSDFINGDHFVGGGVTTLPAVAGYPHITVPAGFVRGLPIGLSFFGAAWSEPTLLRLAYSFEQMTKARKPPRFLATAQ